MLPQFPGGGGGGVGHSGDDGLRGAEVWGGGKVTEDGGKRRDEFSGDQSSVQH